MHIVGSALSQSWPAFALIAGLLIIGSVAASDGLFEALGTQLARLPGGGLTLLVSLLLLVALVTATLNLDTSVAFMTPVLLQSARRRGYGEAPFLYGSVFMSNAASLLLPGSNLTNILILRPGSLSGLQFAARMFPAWAVAVVVTIIVVSMWGRRSFVGGGDEREATTMRWGVGVVGVVGAVVLMLLLSDPALPVLILGIVVGSVQLLRSHIESRKIVEAVSPWTLAVLMAVSVVLGSIARLWSYPMVFMEHHPGFLGASVAAVTANLVNNLPAAVLFAPGGSAHPSTLLLGLDLGPNLAVTGALSALLWLRVSKEAGARPSMLTFSKVGAVVTVCTMVGALLAVSTLS